MIESILPNSYNVKKRPLRMYLDFEYAQSLNPQITFTFLISSKSVHALDYNGRVLVHPDGYLEAGKRKIKAKIRAALREPGFR